MRSKRATIDRFLTHIYSHQSRLYGTVKVKGQKVTPITNSQTHLKSYSKCPHGA